MSENNLGNFPLEAIGSSAQVLPRSVHDNAWRLPGGMFVFSLATAADAMLPWGRYPMQRDRQLRDFWKSESTLAGAVANVGFRNAAFDWEVRADNERLETAITDMLMSAMSNISGGYVGWEYFAMAFSINLYTQDNGSFIELIRDPGMDAASRFKGPNAPVIGISSLDSGQCYRTGDPRRPVIYVDERQREHVLKWYEVIPFSDFPSPIESMYGIGISAVTRVQRMAQIARSQTIFKDEKISGRHPGAIHLLGGVTRKEVEDAQTRFEEEADNKGQMRYIGPLLIAGLDPDAAVSTATLDVATLPDGFDYDAEMKWYINSLALGFGVDYQEFAPLPGGGLGAGGQSETLSRKSRGKSRAVFMKTVERAFKNYGVIPKSAEFKFTQKDTEEELELQLVRTKAMEELAMAVKGGILTPQAARADLEKRGIYDKEILGMIADDYGEDIVQPKQPIGDRGGNTIAEDTRRRDSGKPNQSNRGGRLRKFFEEKIFG